MGLVWTAVLNGGLGIAAYGTSRFGFRQPRGYPRALAACVLAWAWLTIGMEILGSLGFLARGPLLGWVAAGLGIALACLWARGRDSDVVAPRSGVTRWGWDEIVSIALIVWAMALILTASLMGPVNVFTDAPIYHLYFAVRWWKAGRLVLIATPFSENAATYFPAGGDLWLTWLLNGWGDDLLAKVGQVPFLALAGLTVFAMGRRLGSGRASATVAAAWFVSNTPLFPYSFEANVDSIFVAGYLLAVYFFARHALGDDGPSALVLGALGAGLALGTKAPGVVFVPPLLILGATSAVWRGRGPLGKALAGASVVLVPFSVAGYWWLRNAWLTGNPLYPLHLVVFGRVWLAGWYGPDVMRKSQYYLPADNWRELLDLCMSVFDPRLAPVYLAGLAGAWAWGSKERRREDRCLWSISGLAVLNVALFWLLIPYRTQQRFLFHAVGLAAVPLARVFERFPRFRAVGVALLGVHVLTRQGWPFGTGEPPWDFHPAVPNNLVGPIFVVPTDLSQAREAWSKPGALLVVGGSLLVGLMALAAVRVCARAAEKPSPGAWARGLLAVVSLCLLSLSLGYSTRAGAGARERFYPWFPDYVRGWFALDLRSGPKGARIAYAGTGLPYYLLGTGLRNEVRYVNIDAHRDWLLHDYHREASARLSGPATWPTPRPGWDRIHPDYDAWLANLRAEHIQFLVVARVNPWEGAHNVADRDGFPIERVWAEAHPGTFQPVYGMAERDPQFRVFRVRPL